ncbi:ParB/RepB/Spo0J family partition protein [Brachybacterium massiliense]|uniref:ParB/RepB/Spo0J family partition protein n=1 Tax=Brachybacterium massiliense TaxID=1755098 RepID=UPI000B3BBDEE|nr:ParB/RepB/Spo0J family partition protein [Brachybacterium massiliense]
MTQKRGLGRGLGALIPGAGSTSAPEQELRTRTRPADETAGGSGAPRPVDMFFSGERLDSEGRPQRGRGDALDLATGMARAAAERRGRTTTRSAASGSVKPAESEAAQEAPAEASAKKAPAKSTSTRSTASRSTASKPAAPKAEPSKAAASKSTATKSAGTKSAGTKRATTKAGTAAAKSATTGSSTAKSSTAAQRTASTARAEVPAPVEDAPTTPATTEAPTSTAADPAPLTEAPESTAPAAVEESPVVDVEAVTPTPAQTEQPEQAEAPEAPATAETVEESTDLPSDQDDASGLSMTAQDLVSVPGAVFAEIPIHEVRENPRNPRTMFDEDELDELAYSLREVGVLQPVVVRPIPVTEDGESFELVMGERRWRAARRAGLPAIPAIIRETSDDDLLRDALLENLHRTQLNPLEEANAYQQLLDDFGCTQDELGERIGRSRPQITNTLRLLRLPALVQRRLASGAISAGHARALLSLDDPRLMEELAQRIVQEGLSVRAVERLVARGGEQQTTRTPRRSTYDPHVVDLTSRLSNRLEAPVRIDVGKRKGRITLEFTNLEDLERLVENMGLDIPLPSADD